MKNVFRPKLIDCLKEYNKAAFLKDVIAGIIVAVIALPLSIALALASGAGPEQGLYTAIMAGFFIALLGGSRVQISGPTAAFATIVFGIIAADGMAGLALATLMAGLLLILFGVCRLGALIRFVPHSVVVGFTGGIALTLAIGQLKDFMGLTFKKSPAETLEKLWETIICLPTVNFAAFALGIVCLLIMIFAPRIKYISKVPPSLIVVVLASAAVALFDMPVNTVGSLYEVKSGFPAFSFPALSWSAVGAQIPNAFIIAFLAAVESLLSCVVADGMIGDKHNPNTELIAQGAGNMASALFGGIPATGAIARTAANVKNGGRSPVSGIVHALVLLLVLLFAMPLAALIPMPAIAAILLIVAYNMSEWRKFVKMAKTEKADVVFVLVVTCLFTVVFDLVVAIAVGLGLTLLFYLIKKIKAKKAN